MLEAASEEEILKKLLVFGIVWRLLKLKLATMRHKLCELFGITMAKLLDWSVNLALFNLSVLIVFISCSEALPGQLTLQQIENYVTSAFQIVPSTLLNTEVGVG